MDIRCQVGVGQQPAWLQPLRDLSEEAGTPLHVGEELRYQKTGGAVIDLTCRQRFQIPLMKVAAMGKAAPLRPLATHLQHGPGRVQRSEAPAGKTFGQMGDLRPRTGAYAEDPRVSLRDVSGGRDDWVRTLLEQLRTELTSNRTPSQLLVHNLAQALAIHLVRSYRAPLPAGRRSNALQAYKLRRVIDLMNQHLAQDFSLAKLAQAAQLSEYHFSRLFKRATGLSPSHYFIRLRIARARQLLLETERSVIYIGLEVGYSSPSHFSQVFRREVGVTPSAYRDPGRN